MKIRNESLDHASFINMTHQYFIYELLLKVLWFSAIFPYVVLSILCCKALTLDGAFDGIKFLFTPDWERLKESQVWIGKINFYRNEKTRF